MATIGVAAAALLAAAQQTFRSGVDLVTVDVAVTDRSRPVRGLTAQDFSITDNGVRQTILEVSVDEWPLDVTLLADLSAGGILQSSVVSGANRVKGSLRSSDRLRILTVDARITGDLEFRPASELPPVTMAPGSHDAVGARSHIVTYDALVLALATPPMQGRRHVVMLFTAGRDTASFSHASTVLEVAKRSSATVFTVRSFFDPVPFDAPPAGATAKRIPPDPLAIPERFLSDLSDLTGGTVQVVVPMRMVRNDTQRQHISATIGLDGIEGMFLRALDDFRSSYVLRYAAEGVARAGWHELAVRVVKPGTKYDVRARKGYGG
jgi:VWFA-related protein